MYTNLPHMIMNHKVLNQQILIQSLTRFLSLFDYLHLHILKYKLILKFLDDLIISNMDN